MTCNIWLSKWVFPSRLSCGHTYWKPWISVYVKEKVMNKAVVSCPDCWTPLDTETFNKIVSPELKEKYEEFKRQRMVDRNPNLHWCPNVGWDNFVYCIPNHRGKKTKATCEWGHEFCIMWHEPWHPTKSCTNATEEKSFRKFIKKKSVKRWPNCKAIIQKLSGCNHMTWHIWLHQFCWHWGETYTAQHFNSFSTCAIEGDNRIEILIMIILLPLILFWIPFTVVFIARKLFLESVQFPGSETLSYFVWAGTACILGVMMQALIPIALSFLVITWVRFQLRKWKYRF